MKKIKKESKILVIDDKDSLFSISFLNHGARKVVMYESDNRFINGGIIGNYTLLGIKKRKNYIDDNNIFKIINKNFYEEKVEETFDFVFCFESLHLENNKHISMNKKIKKLMSSVKPCGYIYIYYHLVNKNEKTKINILRKMI